MLLSLSGMSAKSPESFRLMIVAGEPSGDAHAAALARSLRERAPHAVFELYGATGPAMRAAGIEAVVRSDELAIMGIVEVARVLPRFWHAFKALKQAAIARRPEAVILVDWPEFNLRLARSLHRRGFRIIYYISPQLWAWRSYRVRSIRRDVDLLLGILPFEPSWYEKRGVTHVEFVGHPLTGEVHPRYGRAEFCLRNRLDETRPIIALLPGSRRKELERILPPMLDAASLIAHARPDVQLVVTVAPSRTAAEVAALIDESRRRGTPVPEALRISQHETREALAAADAAAVASGTATLEAALTATPLVIVYKESPLNWHTLGRLINAEHFGLVNLIAGERIVPELMQDDLTGERLAQELLALLDEERNREARARLSLVTARLGAGRASRRAADSVLRAVREWKGRDEG
ncbi:MAG TPA: lipid-A-disaccharide synthase [Pyrinomonadaceae bacterium]|jgi:lipid-A-disaccharide synthase|nr:lipid-A-disaccharide synthase [Pyrinomonadaceae bacterium]